MSVWCSGGMLLMVVVGLSMTLPASATSRATDLLAFIEPNMGQANTEYSHIVRTADYTALLSASTVRFHLHSAVGDGTLRSVVNTTTMHLIAGEGDAEGTPGAVLSGYSNYLRGRDPEQWLTRIPHLAQVRFAQVYPGIDVVYSLEGAALRYDFIVAPGVGPDAIKLRFDSSDPPTVHASGELQVPVAGGTLSHSAPKIYQELDGALVALDGGFAVDAQGTLSFQVQSRVASRELVIDPQITLSTYLGGSDNDNGLDIALDGSKRIYVAGETWSSDFPLVDPLPPGEFSGSFDGFVARISSDGTALEYATFIGGRGDDSINQIAVDEVGNVILTGYTSSSDYPLVNPVQATFAGGGLFNSDAIVTKLAPSGDRFVYSTYFGGTELANPLIGYEFARGLTLDPRGNAYVVGETIAPDFPATHTPGGRACLENEIGAKSTLVGDTFLAKFTPSGALAFALCLGGGERDAGRGLAVGDDGSVHVIGFTRSDDYPVSPGAFQNALAGDYDVHVTRVAGDGSAVLSSTLVGGSDTEFVQQVRVASDGTSVVGGLSDSDDFPVTFGAYQNARDGGDDAIVFRVSKDARRLLFSTYLGGNTNENGWGLDLDGDDRIYIASDTTSVNLPFVRSLRSARSGAAALGRETLGHTDDVTLSMAGSFELLPGTYGLALAAGNDGVNRYFTFDIDGAYLGEAEIGTERDRTHAIGLLDVDFDESPDLVVAGNDGAPTRLYWRDGSGGFAPPVDLTPARATRAIAVGQLQGTAEWDLVIGNQMQANYFYLGSRDGPGPERAAFPGSEGTATAALTLADVDGNGWVDVVEANDHQLNAIYFNDGSTFTAASFFGTDPAPSTSIAAGDLDGDGDRDIVVGNNGAPNRVFFNEGNGVFNKFIDLDAGPATTTGVMLDDLNFDGLLDIMTVDGGYGSTYVNLGEGNFHHVPLTIEAEAATVLYDGYPINSPYRAGASGVPIRALLPSLDEVYLAVLDPAGRQLLFSTLLGGAGFDGVNWGLLVDETRNAYVSGTTRSLDFPLTSDALQPSLTGGSDLYVARVDLGDIELPERVRYRTVLDLSPSPLDGIDQVVVEWSTLACGVSAAGDLYDYEVAIYAGGSRLYTDVVFADGFQLPLGTEVRDDPVWSFTLPELQLQALATGVDRAITQPGAQGIRYRVASLGDLAAGGALVLERYQDGQLQDAAEAVVLGQYTDVDGDCDRDQVNGLVDNCVFARNADQRDTDGDGIGNRCDADLDNNCLINEADRDLMREALGSQDPNADLDGNGVVNRRDLLILRGSLGEVPGPSGLANLCSVRP